MANQSNVLTFSPRETKHPLYNKLKEINSNTTKVKLRAKRSSSGKYILYLEQFHKGRRIRDYLELYIYGQKNTKGKDKETLKRAVAILHKKDSDYLEKKRGIHADKSKVEKGFVEYFEELVQTKYLKDKSWRHTLLYLKKFFKHDKPFYELDKKQFERFKEFLFNQERLKSNNTIHTYFAKVKAALNKAVDDDYIVKNPAKYISIPKQDTKREYLDLEELKILDKTACKSMDTKNAFLFSCFTGLRVSDLKHLTWNSVQKGYLYYRQEKTKNNERLKLSRRALKILEKQRAYQESQQKGLGDNRIFLLISDNHSNHHIKTWVKEAGILKNITWHSGRHTFATLNLTYGNDIYTTSKLLGHKDVKVTQIYAKLIDSKKDAAVDNLPDW